MSDDVLRIGMPAGSLADPNRGGNLVQLLEQSGFRTSGYQSGGPSKFTTVNFLYGWDGRPQEFATQLGIGELDVAIAGDDWIRERVLELKYEYGQDRGAAPGDVACGAAACAWSASSARTRNGRRRSSSSRSWPAASRSSPRWPRCPTWRSNGSARRLSEAGVAERLRQVLGAEVHHAAQDRRGRAHLRNLGQDRGQGRRTAAPTWAWKSPRAAAPSRTTACASSTRSWSRAPRSG